jgi:hypothetical protein
MTGGRIQRKELWKSLGSIKRQKEWMIVAEKLKLPVSGGKGSHCVIRNSTFPDHDIRSVIATVQEHLYKEANQTIFKNLLDYGIAEDDIWKVLGKIK